MKVYNYAEGFPYGVMYVMLIYVWNEMIWKDNRIGRWKNHKFLDFFLFFTILLKL